MRIHPFEKVILLNEIPDVPFFISSWDGDTNCIIKNDLNITDLIHSTNHNSVSRSGNINLRGSELCSTSAIYTPSHPEFMESVEDGVRDLVLLLIDRCNYVTYSSCAGHKYSDRHAFHKRYISILPRNKQEYEHILHMLSKLSFKVNNYGLSNSIELKVIAVKLFSISNGVFYDAIDLIFESLTSSPSEYFSQLEEVYIATCKSVLLLSEDRRD